MTATIHRDVNYEGPFALLGPGFYSGRDLVGCPHRSLRCEDLDNAISSVRVDPNTILAFADGHALTARGGGARVLVGPAEVPDLGALGMSDRVSSLLVVPFRAYDSAAPPPPGGVTLYDGYGLTGRRSRLRRGDYPKARLASEEVRMPGREVASLAVEEHVLAVLYSGEGFEAAADAVVVVGPAAVEDLERLGMRGRVSSIRVLYSDPFDAASKPPRKRAGQPVPPPAAPPAAPPAQAPPQVVIIQESRRVGLQMFALIVLFIAIVAFAAYATARAAPSPVVREAAEASLVAQAGVPLAVTSALL